MASLEDSSVSTHGRRRTPEARASYALCVGCGLYAMSYEKTYGAILSVTCCLANVEKACMRTNIFTGQEMY